MRAVLKLGEIFWRHFDDLRYTAAVIGTMMYVSVRRRNWPPAVRHIFAQEIFTVGIGPLFFISGVAIVVGISVVVQLAFWTGKAGQSQLLGPLLVAVVARELGPILTNIIVTVRSSTAMTTELAVLKIGGEIRDLEARGIDPFVQVVMPRVLAICVSTLCLALIFIVVAFASGYFFGAWLGTGSRDMWSFINTVLNALRPQDLVSIVAKTVLPALFISATCCIGGLSVGESLTNIPSVTQRALTRSIAGLFLISAAVSLLTYLYS